MDKEYYDALSKVRLDRAKELLEESKKLLNDESYKSANNRAFYAMEKAIKALLALEKTDATTHNGVLKQFNFIYVLKGDGTFTTEDYRIVSKADQIRNVSDYDDFYISNKEEARQMVENATYLVEKISLYVNAILD